MLRNPAPRLQPAASNPAPSSVTSNVSVPGSSRMSQADRGPLPRVLARVLQGLQAAEVHRRLDVGGVPAERSSLHRGGECGVAGRGEQRVAQPVRSQQWRVDPVREAPQLLRGVPDLGAELLQQAGQVRVLPGQLRGQRAAGRQARSGAAGRRRAGRARCGGARRRRRPRCAPARPAARRSCGAASDRRRDHGGQRGSRLRDQARAPPGTR